jgi:hypothetical protein
MHVGQYVWKEKKEKTRQKSVRGSKVRGGASGLGGKLQKKLLQSSVKDRNLRKMEECSLRDDKENQAPNNHKAIHFSKVV